MPEVRQLSQSPEPAPRNPALLLSEEALDLICDKVLQFPPSRAQRTLASFCLVSRTWLDTGRRALYYAPLDASLPSWRAASTLLRTLETEPGLAQRVRLLSRLASESFKVQKWLSGSRTNVSGMAPIAIGGGWLVQREKAGQTWALKILEACTKTRVVSLPIGVDPKGAVEFAKALPKTVAEVTVRANSSLSDILDSFEAWSIAIGLNNLPQLKVVKIFGVSTGFNQDHTSRMAFAISDLTIGCQNLLDVRPLLPQEEFIPFLKSLKLSDPFLQPQRWMDLINVVGPHLASLSILSSTSTKQGLSLPLNTYTFFSSNRGFSPPSSFYTSLPHLRRLKLEIKGFSVSNLTAIAESSPLLSRIDLHSSGWSFGEESGQPLDDFDAEWPKVEALFADPTKLVNLKSVRLGWLPILEEDGEMEKLESIARERGIKLSSQACEDDSESEELPDYM